MLYIKDKKIFFNGKYCQQCGVCSSVCPQGAISYHLKQSGLSNIVINYEKCVTCGKCVNVCPSTFSLNRDYSIAAFKKKSYFIGYNIDNKIRRESSSGGVCKTLIIESLKMGYVDGVYSLKKSNIFPHAEGAFYDINSIPDYEDIPNSVYHSLMIGKNIREIPKCHRLMIIGTSCQLQAMSKALKNKCDELIRVCIFCKQQKTLDSTRFLAKSMGISVPGDLNFSTRYRGMGWPGIVEIEGRKLSYNRAAQLPFGRRLWSVPGCNICGDPFGLDANSDLTLMDPWSIRQSNDLGETLISIHTSKGLDFLKIHKAIKVYEMKFSEVEPALNLKDIERKRLLVDYFKGLPCSTKIKIAGNLEKIQRKYLQAIVSSLPRLPFIFYRILCKFPDFRNIILK